MEGEASGSASGDGDVDGDGVTGGGGVRGCEAVDGRIEEGLVVVVVTCMDVKVGDDVTNVLVNGVGGAGPGLGAGAGDDAGDDAVVALVAVFW